MNRNFSPIVIALQRDPVRYAKPVIFIFHSTVITL